MRHAFTRRRWLVGASSACLALPALEYFMPRTAQAGGPGPRLLVYYFPNGRRPEWWVPTATADGLVFPVAEMQPFADQALSLVNLTNTAAIDSPGAAHAMGTGTVMTCSTIPDVAGGVLYNDISLDQILAKELTSTARFDSLQWSAGEPGPCDVGGSSCAYTQSISWTGPAAPRVPTIDPRAAFERLFGSGVDGLEGPAADIRRVSKQSTIDFVREDAAALQARLGHNDQMRLEAYFDALRELEKALSTSGLECAAAPEPPVPGLPYDLRVQAFHQLIALALQCNQTRILSFMIEFGLSGRSHDFLLAPGGHHALSHFGDQADKDRLEIVERWQTKQFADMLSVLRATPGDNGGTLLDETIVLAIPSMGEGASHDHGHNCPMLFGGKGVIQATNRQIAFPATGQAPLANLHVSLLHAYGIEGAFGKNGAIFGDDGTAPIDGIVV
jgi:hypothetical protein